MSCELPTVILNSFQDLSAEKVKKKARSEMLKHVQHDSMHTVILNLVQDLSAEKNKKRFAVRC